MLKAWVLLMMTFAMTAAQHSHSSAERAPLVRPRAAAPVALDGRDVSTGGGGGASFVYLLHIPKTAGQSLYRDLPAALNCSRVLPRFGYDRGGGSEPLARAGGAQRRGRGDARRGRGGRSLLSVGKKRSKTDVRWAPDTYRDEMLGLLGAEGYDLEGCNVYHAEGVYELADDFRAVPPGRPALVVTLLREPTAHVLSLFEHNRNSGFDVRQMQSLGGAQPTLSQWLRIALARNTTSLGTTHNPYNMQTARLSGTRGPTRRTRLGVYPRKGELYRDELVPDLDAALQHVRHEAWFVGVTEFYRESLCLLRELALGSLPKECVCPPSRRRLSSMPDSQPLDSAPPLRESHNQHHARYDDQSYTARELKLIADATRLDRVLHGAAVARFTRHLLDAERRHGVQILCRDGSALPSLPPAEH